MFDEGTYFGVGFGITLGLLLGIATGYFATRDFIKTGNDRATLEAACMAGNENACKLYDIRFGDEVCF